MHLTSIDEFCTVIDDGVHVVSFISYLPFRSCRSNWHQVFKAKFVQAIGNFGCFEVSSYSTSTFVCFLRGSLWKSCSMLLLPCLLVLTGIVMCVDGEMDWFEQLVSVRWNPFQMRTKWFSWPESFQIFAVAGLRILWCADTELRTHLHLSSHGHQVHLRLFMSQTFDVTVKLVVSNKGVCQQNSVYDGDHEQSLESFLQFGILPYLFKVRQSEFWDRGGWPTEEKGLERST